MRHQIFVDLDGVLCDFDKGYELRFGHRPSKENGSTHDVDWQAVRGSKDFYATLPPMEDYLHLWQYVEPYKPIVLTGVPSSVPEAQANKQEWVIRHLPKGTPMVACLSAEKCKYAEPGDILIDDWTKYQHLWVAAGGVWVTHTSAVATINKLRELGY